MSNPREKPRPENSNIQYAHNNSNIYFPACLDEMPCFTSSLHRIPYYPYVHNNSGSSCFSLLNNLPCSSTSS